ncbi:SLC37A3, partial [Cervus elaphus hippelaphus]
MVEIWLSRGQPSCQESPFKTSGTLQGFISDMLQRRAPVLALSLLLAIGSLVGYSRSPNNKSINALLMAVTGFFIGGPSNMISSAISADLGRQELIQGSSEALATVTGIVDGTGSVGAAVGQYLVSLIQDNLGWMWVFYFFILMTSCTILFISPLIVRETCSLMQRRQTHNVRTLPSFNSPYFGFVLRTPTQPQIIRPLSALSAAGEADQSEGCVVSSTLQELMIFIYRRCSQRRAPQIERIIAFCFGHEFTESSSSLKHHILVQHSSWVQLSQLRKQKYLPVIVSCSPPSSFRITFNSWKSFVFPSRTM